MALGAARGTALALVLRQGLTLAGVGGAVGLAGALALSRLRRSQRYGVRAADPATLVMVVAPLGAVAFLAALVPARRATRVAPATALRGDSRPAGGARVGAPPWNAECEQTGGRGRIAAAHAHPPRATRVVACSSTQSANSRGAPAPASP